MANGDDYRQSVDKGIAEGRWTFGRILWPILGVVVLLWILSYFLGWFSEAGQVAQQEFGPSAALEKYQWFIERQNSILKMDQDIKNFEGRLINLEQQYKSDYGQDPAKWSLATQTQYNHERQTARDDLLAVISQRNHLVQEYNANSQKFNWEPFRQRTDLPPESFEEYKSMY